MHRNQIMNKYIKKAWYIIEAVFFFLFLLLLLYINYKLFS